MQVKISWNCLICGGIHIKRVDPNFNCFEFTCFDALRKGRDRPVTAYIVKLNPVKCLACTQKRQLCYPSIAGNNVVIKENLDELIASRKS